MNNFIILKTDNTLPFGHYGLYFSHSVYLFKQLENISPQFIAEMFNVNNVYPPLLYLTPIPLYFIFNIDYDLAAFSIGLFYISIFVFSLYLLGAYFYKPSVGIMAAFIGSLFPGIFGYSRVFIMAFPMVAILTLNIFLMFKTEVFKKTEYALLFAFVLALGMLMKKFYLIYIFFLILIYLIENRGLIFKKSLRFFSNILIILTIIITISGGWYFRHMSSIFHQLKSEQTLIFCNKNYNFDPVFFFKLLINYQLGWFLLSLFFVAIIYCIIKKRCNIFILSWIILPYCISSIFVVHGSSRYTMAMLPAMAIIIAYGLISFSDSLRVRKKFLLNRLFIVTILGVSIFNFFKLSYGGGPSVFSYKDETDRFFYTGLLTPKKINWDIKNLEKILIQNNKSRTIVDGFGCWYILNDYLNNFIKNNDVSASFNHLEFDQRDRDHRELIKKSDFIILRSDNGSSAPNASISLDGENLDKINCFINIFYDYENEFKLFDKIIIGDDARKTAFLIYQRI